MSSSLSIKQCIIFTLGANQLGVRQIFTTWTEGSSLIAGTNCALKKPHQVQIGQTQKNDIRWTAISNNPNFFSTQIHRMIPAWRMKLDPLESLSALNVGIGRYRKYSNSRNDDVSLYNWYLNVTGFSFLRSSDSPQLFLFVPNRVKHFGIKSRESRKVVLVKKFVPVFKDITLTRELFFPVWMELWGETVPMNWDIAGATRVGVISPGTPSWRRFLNDLTNTI